MLQKIKNFIWGEDIKHPNISHFVKADSDNNFIKY